MSDLTKMALENAFKEALAHKPLEKITISELTNACGLSRMTFYYHFHDIYELAEWSLMKETESALAGRVTTNTWQEALRDLFDLVIENRKYIGGLLHPSTRDHLESYINHLTDAFFLEIIVMESGLKPCLGISHRCLRFQLCISVWSVRTFATRNSEPDCSTKSQNAMVTLASNLFNLVFSSDPFGIGVITLLLIALFFRRMESSGLGEGNRPCCTCDWMALDCM